MTESGEWPGDNRSPHGGTKAREVFSSGVFALKRLKGYEAREREAALGTARWDAEVERALEIGLPATDSIGDRTISTFARTELPHFAGINTFMRFPFVEDVREVGDYDVATIDAPFDMGTTYRSGTRFGLAAGVALSLIAQIGEQVDYLRFMPEKTPENSKRWWAAVLSAGPGWVVLGALKQIGGAFLAFYLISQVTGVGADRAVEPISQFVNGFELLFPSGIALVVATILVILSQMKINVTNAYAGSLAWSNFFSRIFHWHPGRVWWVFLNVGIALTLMLFGVFGFLNFVLGFYSNVAIAWIGAVVADLVINKPFLKVSPSYIEFKRAHLYGINPVGFGSMLAGAAVSIPAFFGAFEEYAQAFSPYLALTIAFVLSPVLALTTKGKYYIAREGSTSANLENAEDRYALTTCGQCGQDFESPDTAHCPFHETPICSLCCTLEKKCHDMCKKPLEIRAKPSAEPAGSNM